MGQATTVNPYFSVEGLLDVLEHPNQDRYTGQWIVVVRRDTYVYLVPFVKHDSVVILKTSLPSRISSKDLEAIQKRTQGAFAAARVATASASQAVRISFSCSITGNSGRLDGGVFRCYT